MKHQQFGEKKKKKAVKVIICAAVVCKHGKQTVISLFFSKKLFVAIPTLIKS